jgi:two-component sensor histidine kinase
MFSFQRWFSKHLPHTLSQAQPCEGGLEDQGDPLEDLVRANEQLQRDNEALARQIAEYQEAENELRQKAQDLARSHAFVVALNRVTARVESTPDPDEVLVTLGQELRELGLTCVVALREADDPALVVRYGSIASSILKVTERLSGLTLSGYRIPPHAPYFEDVVQKGRTLYVSDPSSVVADLMPGLPRAATDRAVRLIGILPDVHAIYMPLTVEEHVRGVVVVWGKNLRESDVPALSVFGRQITGAFEAARLFEAERQRARERSTLLEAARAVSSTLDLEETLAILAEQIVMAVGVDGCTISRWDREADAVITWVEWRREVEWVEDNGQVYPLDQFPATRAVLETGQPHTVLVSDPQADAAEVAHLSKVGSSTLLMLPLARGDQAIGLLELEVSEGDREFTEDEIRLCQALANQAAVAIENSQLYESARQELGERLRAEEALQKAHDELELRVQERTAELQNLQHVTNALLSLEELSQVMTTVAEGIVTQIGYDMVLVTRYVEEEDAFTGLALYPSPSQFDRLLRIVGRTDLKADPTRYRVSYHRGENPLIDRVLDGEVVNADSMAGLFHPWVPHTAAVAAQRMIGLKAFVNLPMQVKGKIVGTIVAGVRNPPIRADQQQALARVAAQAAVALENARLYEAERQRSEELERSNAFITALSQVAARIEATPDPDQVLETLGVELRRLGITYFLALLEPDTQELVGRHVSLDPCILAKAEKLAGLSLVSFRIPCERWPVAEVLEPGGACYVPDLITATADLLPHVPKPLFDHIVRLAGVTPELGAAYLPLKVEEQLLGIMTIWGPDLREGDVPALTVFANQVAVALENARLYERAQREVAARMCVEEQIRASLAEKEVLLKEVHHRVKNNLQVVSSLLSLQSDHVQDLQALESFRDSQNRIRSMALIHEKLYQSPDLARIDFAEYVRNLATFLFHAYGADSQVTRLKIQTDDVYLGVDDAVPCGLILNELVSNALKHAFPGGRSGEISIGLGESDSGRMILEVSDDGVGFPPDQDPHSSESLGLQLVTTLVSQLDGTFEFDRRTGTKYRIALNGS